MEEDSDRIVVQPAHHDPGVTAPTPEAAPAAESGYETSIAISMELADETKLEAEFIRDYFGLNTPAESVALSLKIMMLLVSEIKSGKIILTEDKLGRQSKLVLRRKK